MTIALKENRLWIIVSTMVNPHDIDLVALDMHEVKDAKDQRSILDGIRDHLTPHVAKKKIAYNMWTTFKGLYEANNENQIMALKEKLQGTKMAKGESVASFLTWVAQIKDELAVVGEVISDFELVRIALKGFTKEWEDFVKCVVT